MRPRHSRLQQRKHMKEDRSTSWVADARKLLQDFVAPEVRAVTARLDTSDKLAEERHAALLSSSKERHAALLDMLEQRDKVAAERHAALLDMFQERDRTAADRHALLLEKVEGARREILLQPELAIAKARLGEQPVNRSEAASSPQ